MPPLPELADTTHHTHGSTVYLVDDLAYKVKRPIDLGFLDYSTLARRKHFCEEEVRLNRRWSEGIYLGVQALDAQLAPTEGEAAEWAVVMARFDDADTLLARVETGEADAALLRRVGEAVGRMHLAAPHPDDAATHAGVAALKTLMFDNFDATRGSDLLPEGLHTRLEEASRQALRALIPHIQQRVDRAVAIHGDLRLQHVLVRGERIDCVDGIEFDRGLRVADPIADVAFLWMDLSVRGEPDLAQAFLDGWLAVTGDDDALVRLPFEAAYRSIVRAKVAMLEAATPGIGPAQVAAARSRALRHWLWAAARLLPADERPALLGVGGLPASGKSTVARALAERHGFVWVRADVVRKELVGLAPDSPATVRVAQALYRPAHTGRTYATCRERAREVLARGGRVVVDATFSDPEERTRLHALGVELGVPHHLLLCHVPEPVALDRLRSRPPGPSDATPEVREAMRQRWPGDHGGAPLSTEGALADTLQRLERWLLEHHLALPRAPQESP